MVIEDGRRRGISKPRLEGDHYRRVLTGDAEAERQNKESGIINGYTLDHQLVYRRMLGKDAWRS